jgi:hypothetical protein
MPGVGYLLGGVLASLGSPRTAYAVAGIGVLVLVAVALVAHSWLGFKGRRARELHAPRPGDLPLPEPCAAAPSYESRNVGER